MISLLAVSCYRLEEKHLSQIQDFDHFAAKILESLHESEDVTDPQTTESEGIGHILPLSYILFLSQLYVLNSN
jgi:hypothetical protein